jgi:hypothetical protein
VTINLHNCRILLALTPEQFERLIEATRDGAAIVTTAEPVPPNDPPSSTFPAAPAATAESSEPALRNVVPLRRVAA